MRTVAITSLIVLGSTLCAGGPSADQLAGLMKAGAAIQDGASITTRFGGSTVSVTRQNGVVTCTVDGKPIALRVPGPAPKPAALTPVVVAITQVQQGNINGVPSLRLPNTAFFQNPLWWFGTPNPTPPPAVNTRTFEPLASLPGWAQGYYGWYRDLNFEACVLGLGTTITPSVGPYGTATSSISTGGC